MLYAPTIQPQARPCTVDIARMASAGQACRQCPASPAWLAWLGTCMLLSFHGAQQYPLHKAFMHLSVTQGCKLQLLLKKP